MQPSAGTGEGPAARTAMGHHRRGGLGPSVGPRVGPPNRNGSPPPPPPWGLGPSAQNPPKSFQSTMKTEMEASPQQPWLDL